MVQECVELIKASRICVCHFALGCGVIIYICCRYLLLHKKPKYAVQEVAVLRNNGNYLPNTGSKSAVMNAIYVGCPWWRTRGWRKRDFFFFK